MIFFQIKHRPIYYNPISCWIYCKPINGCFEKKNLSSTKAKFTSLRRQGFKSEIHLKKFRYLHLTWASWNTLHGEERQRDSSWGRVTQTISDTPPQLR